MKRLYPQQIQDTIYLSRLLEYYLTYLQESPLELRLKGLAYDTGIPVSVFECLMNLYRNPEDSVHLMAQDFHILFTNILFRYPSVKLWITAEGEVLISL